MFNNAAGCIRDRQGVVLVIALLLITVLSLLGIAANQNTITDTVITSNYISSLQSFYLAEAGIELAKSYVKHDLVNDNKNWANATFKFPYHTSGQSMTVGACDTTSAYCPINDGESGVINGIPSATTTKTIAGATGTITIALRNIGSSILGIRSTGAIGSSATSTVEVLLKQKPAMQYGVFGDKSVDMKANGKVYSYDSRATPNPDPANYPTDSTHNADIGSNESVVLHSGTYVDGNVGLGEAEGGENATYTEGGATVTGSPVDVARVSPDPLGAVGGALAAVFTSVSSSNDNGYASPVIMDNKIDATNEVTLTGKAGGANYYLTSLTLGNGGVLTVDATAGPVNIYLTGSLEAKNGSSINVNGLPTSFTIYCNKVDTSGSNSIVFKNSSTFKGVVYAPYAGIEMKNSADAFGLLWGKRVDIKNSGNFFFDAALKDKFLSSDYDVIAWRQVR